MRHSFRPFQAQPSRHASQDPPATAPSKPADNAASESAPVNFTPYSSTGMSPAESQATSSSSRHQSFDIHSAQNLTQGTKSVQSVQSTHAVPAAAQTSSKQLGHGMMNGTSSSVGVPVHLRVSTGQQKPSMAEPATYASSSTSATSADDVAELQSRRLSDDGASSSGQATVSGWHPHDPEHLIVNGLGGAFLHPTHVFSPSRFVSGLLTCLGSLPAVTSCHFCHQLSHQTDTKLIIRVCSALTAAFYEYLTSYAACCYTHLLLGENHMTCTLKSHHTFVCRMSAKMIQAQAQMHLLCCCDEHLQP